MDQSEPTAENVRKVAEGAKSHLSTSVFSDADAKVDTEIARIIREKRRVLIMADTDPLDSSDQRPRQHTTPRRRGAARTIGTAALSAAVFMNVLDSSIANVSIPTIAGGLGRQCHTGTWVITSFAVANAITVPLTGWLTQRFGQVRLFVLSVLLFVVSSWLCGFRVAEVLVAFASCRARSRAYDSTFAIPDVGLLPQRESGMALALWSMTILAGPVAGPLLGGWISDN